VIFSFCYPSPTHFLQNGIIGVCPCEPRDARDSDGSSGVRTGSTTHSGCFMTTRCVGREPDRKPPNRIGLITLDLKHTGKRSAGNPHAGFDEAGTGNQLTVWLVRHSQRKRRETDRPNLRSMAPVLDPTTCSSLALFGMGTYRKGDFLGASQDHSRGGPSSARTAQ
jgi:hypothetical protein